MPSLKARRSKPKLLSRTIRPPDMTLHAWQLGLRQQIAQTQELTVRNTGGEPVFSEFMVTNPATRRTYRVAIRGEAPGMNYCTCPDYAVNTLGTCKHIEKVLHRLRQRHARVLRAGYQPPFAEVFVRYGAQRRIMFSPGRDCPDGLIRLARRYFDEHNVLDGDACLEFNRFLEAARRHGDHPLRVYEDAAALLAEMRDAHRRHAQLKAKYGRLNAGIWGSLLKVSLYPYQREGALFASRMGRAIIADEMGLGKTIQAIAAAEILARECGVERVLIVCPTSLKYQWQHEIGQFSRRPATVIEGLTHVRASAYAAAEGFFKITNYDVIRRDLPAIAKWSPDLVILDEAQRIKNWQTRTAQSVKRLDSRYAIVLTGTPLENRIDELHSIVEFVDRHRLGPLFAFKAAHEILEEDSSKVIGYQHLGRLNGTLAPILIRRQKAEVLRQLPPRMDKNVLVPMTDQQWVPHRENQEIVARIVAKWRRYRFLTEADQLRLRIALQYMRMSCDSTYLVDHQTRHQTKLDELERVLEEILERPEAKVVIFSQWVRMNELVAERLEERDWGYVHLHGGVPARERKELTRALREDAECRVFLSSDAGGVGLNLQSASTVINLDLPWNPAVLEQRIGRVHRLGQREPVRVVNLISEGTIEQGMLSLLAFKKSMFAGVLDGTADQVMMGEGALNRFMKTVETATSSIPVITQTPQEPENAGAEAAAVASESESAVETDQPAEGAASQPGAAGDLLTRTVTALSTLAQSLAGLQPAAEKGPPGSGGVRLVQEPSSGQPELRIPLSPAVLEQWTGLLSGLSAVLQGWVQRPS